MGVDHGVLPCDQHPAANIYSSKHEKYELEHSSSGPSAYECQRIERVWPTSEPRHLAAQILFTPLAGQENTFLVDCCVPTSAPAKPDGVDTGRLSRQQARPAGRGPLMAPIL